MAGDNKTLGRFELVGIPPAPRGVPQVEVTFDIDSNGIVSVSAKDLGTNKEQSIKISANSGLNEDEIKRMVKDAEAHADEDRKRKQTVETRNKLDSMVYSTEKSMADLKDKLTPEEQGSVNSAIEEARKALEGTDEDAMNKAYDVLMKASHKVTEELYKKASANQQAAGGAQSQAGAEAQSGEAASGSADKAGAGDNVVDADFEEVKK